ncbi:MAG: hemerythrin domain-containing protein [Nitrososphaerota archaeon]|nr:hemerythrin domain-containing protein [Nitrososphaerota archaeon]MDG7023929.1 hemerythrin domain-containing protein [Nitrososphaerota archaeon]
MNVIGIPESIKEEHEELFAGLRSLAYARGPTGKAVKELLEVLEPHFEKEDEVAMPLLGAVAYISKRETGDGLDKVILLQERLASELDSMLLEHKAIGDLIVSAKAAAKKEKNADALALLQALEHHAKIEEEVLYPAAILAGVAAKAMKEAVPA